LSHELGGQERPLGTFQHIKQGQPTRQGKALPGLGRQQISQLESLRATGGRQPPGSKETPRLLHRFLHQNKSHFKMSFTMIRVSLPAVKQAKRA
jgi:hypothetical protein